MQLQKFLSWPDASQIVALDEAFDEACLLKNEAVFRGVLDEELLVSDPTAAKDSFIAERYLAGLVMQAPSWVSANFWLSGMWTLRLLKENEPLIFYGVPTVAALALGIWLSKLLS